MAHAGIVCKHATKKLMLLQKSFVPYFQSGGLWLILKISGETASRTVLKKRGEIERLEGEDELDFLTVYFLIINMDN